MKPKIFSAIIGVLLVFGLSWLFFFRDYLQYQSGNDFRPPREFQTKSGLNSAFNADAEVNLAMDRLKTRPGKAIVITGDASRQRQIALTFDGLTDRGTVQKILDLLRKYNSKATFFVDGMQTAEDPQTVVDIKKAGHKIENYSLQGKVKMEDLTLEQLVNDFCRSQRIVKLTADVGPHLLKCNETNYTDPVLQAAMACGFKGLVKSDIHVTALTAKNMNSSQLATTFVSKIRTGSIVSVKLKQVKARQSSTNKLPPSSELTEKELVDAVERLLAALNQAKFALVYVENFSAAQSVTNKTSSIHAPASFASVFHQQRPQRLLQSFEFLQEQLRGLISISKAAAAASDDEHTGADTREIRLIHTTEPALAYSFSGLTNKSAVQDVLNRLKRIDSKGTFFIMEAELRQQPQLVRQIIGNGHEIGLAIRPKEGASSDSIRTQVFSGLKLLRLQFGVTTNLVKQPLGAVAEETLQGVVTAGGVMIGQSITVVQAKHKDHSSAEHVIAELFPRSMRALARGQIVHFRMDYYTNPLLAGDLVEAIKRQKIDNIAFSTFYDNPDSNPANDSRYRLKTVGAILNNQRYSYRYPVDMEAIPTELRREGPAYADPSRSLIDKVACYYIGNPAVNEEDRVLNFSRMENRRIDKGGLVHTSERVIFLTFDDWGTDASINKVLYVLRKHKVVGTFFIITRSVLNNPNLLRAIAAEGHEVGDHSEYHVPMVVVDPNSGKQVASPVTKLKYQQELQGSYHKLLQVVGDVTVNGKRSLTRLFRPPQLAISRTGMEAVFDAGFEYVVSGSYTTQDYAAKDVTELVNGFLKGIYTASGELKKGSILVMHITDGTVYTPFALDVLLTANAAKADSDPTKFSVGRLSDYLRKGYSQKNRTKSLELTRLAKTDKL